MPLRRTMGTLVASCRRRVDMKTNQARNDDDFKASISEVYGDLWAIVAEAGRRYFETSTTFTANGAASYVEPTDHFGTVRVARVFSDGRESPLDELMPQEEWCLKGRTGDAIAYTLIDDQVFLYPTPSSGQYKMYYIPQPPDLSNYADNDVVDVVGPPGLSLIVWGTAVIVHGELEGNAMLALQKEEQARKNLAEFAPLRSFNEPARVFANHDLPTFPRGGEYR